MKKLAEVLKAVNKEINDLSKKLDQLSKKAEKLMKAAATKKVKPKALSGKKTVKKAKAVPAKKPAKKKVAKTAPAPKKETARKTAKKTVKKTVKKAAKKTAKKPVRKPAAPATPTNKVLTFMKRYKKGVSISMIKKGSGLDDKQISNILHRASKEGKIKRVARGVYQLV